MLPFLTGGNVEVEERRPRTWNEPRRKRLSFVKKSSHSRRRSDDEDWALVPRDGTPGRRLENDADTWDLHQWDAQRRFLENDHQRLQLDANRRDIERERYFLALPAFARQQQGHPNQWAGQQQQQQPRVRWDQERPMIEERVPRGNFWRAHHGSSSSGSDIMTIVDGDFDDHHGGGGGEGIPRPPLSIEKVNDHAEIEEIIDLSGLGIGGGGGRGRSKSPKGKHKKDKKKKSSSKKDKKKKKKKHDDSSDDSDSDDSSNDSFTKGFVAGRKASLSRGSPSPRRWGSMSRSGSRGGGFRRARFGAVLADDSDSDGSFREWRRRRRGW